MTGVFRIFASRLFNRQAMRHCIKSLCTLLVLAAVLLCACTQTSGIRRAVQEQLRDYPESRAQDIYKSFCQDKLGPEHLIPNPEGARAYLMEELAEYRADLDSGLYTIPQVRYVPTGDAGNYVRVDLSVVLDSLVSAEALLDAFVRSANAGQQMSEEAWTAEWRKVARVLRTGFPFIPELLRDLDQIDSLMAEGHYILHHSPVFNATYHPHYRIIARDLLDFSN